MCSNIFRDIRVYFEIFRPGFWIEIVNISYELIFFRCLSKCKLHWVASKVYMTPSGFIHFARDPMGCRFTINLLFLISLNRFSDITKSDL